MSTITLNEKHSTPYVQAYTGDLSQLVSHNTTSKNPYLFVDQEKLRIFLQENNLLTGAEHLPYNNSVNGTAFFMYHPDLTEHQKIAKWWHTGHPYNLSPNDQEEQKKALEESTRIGTKLKISAYVSNPVSVKRYKDARPENLNPLSLDKYEENYCAKEIKYEPAKPEDFTSESILRVITHLEISDCHFFKNYQCLETYENEYASEFTNYVLTSLHQTLFPQQEGDKTQLLLSRYSTCDVQLKTNARNDHTWAQTNLPAALQKILYHPLIEEALTIIYELAGITIPSSKNVTNPIRKDILDQRRDANQKVFDNILSQYYHPTIQKASDELKSDPDVMKALEII